jgi:hypothetical protein
MGVTAFPHPAGNPNYPGGQVEGISERHNPDWLGIAVGSTFLVGSLLILSGKKRAGLVVTSAASALTLLDHQETVREWWNTMPRYLDHAQHLLNEVQNTVDDIGAKRDRLRAMFERVR